MRNYSPIDRLLMQADQAMRTIHARAPKPERDNPASGVEDAIDLSDEEQKLSARLLRVDHAGEVAAQGLYHGQALTARNELVRAQMQQSSDEETDHLAWCEQRLEELDSNKSMLGPLWYLGSFTMGAAAGLAGDRWSLGFVNETERQVVKHLDNHLQRISPADEKSRAILEQMRIDETHHADIAHDAGAAQLPAPIKGLMKMVSKVMTTTAYWI